MKNETCFFFNPLIKMNYTTIDAKLTGLILPSSAVGQAQGEQKELVWPQSVRRGGCGRPVQED